MAENQFLGFMLMFMQKVKEHHLYAPDTIWAVKNKPLEPESWLKKEMVAFFMLFHFLHNHFALKSIPFKINPQNWLSAMLGRVPANHFLFEK